MKVEELRGRYVRCPLYGCGAAHDVRIDKGGKPYAPCGFYGCNVTFRKPDGIEYLVNNLLEKPEELPLEIPLPDSSKRTEPRVPERMREVDKSKLSLWKRKVRLND